MAAISFLLLSSGLAMCGWRFATASTGTIRNLLGAIFFLSAGYNAILGASSFFNLESASIAIIAHLTLTALALVSVYTLYYIFAPEDSPAMTLTAVSIISALALSLPSVSTFCLLIISFCASAYIFYQLFKNSETRSLKISSVIFITLQAASVLHTLVPITAIQLALGLIGMSFLLWSITTPAIRGAVAIFVVLLGWRAILSFGLNWNSDQINLSVWPDTYHLIIICAPWLGFKASQRHGGFTTALGKAIALFTIGLLLQEVAQITYGFYVNYVGVAVPYPSLADLGWFSSIISYLIGAIFLSQALNTRKLLSTWNGKLKLILPAIGAFFLYWLTVSRAGYIFNWQEPLITSLDIAYSIIGAGYLAFGVLALFAVKEKTYVIAKNKVFIILVALGIQFFSDTNFIYQVTAGTWIDGSYGDIIMFIGYFFMVLAIIRLGTPAKINGELTRPINIKSVLIQAPECSTPKSKTLASTYIEALNLCSAIRTDVKNQNNTMPQNTTPSTFP